MAETLPRDVSSYLAKVASIENEGRPIERPFDLPTVEHMSPELLHIADEIAAISGTWNPVEIYTADAQSIVVERQKVFDAFDGSTAYDPHFTYSYADSLDLRDAREQLLSQMKDLRRVNGGDRVSRLFRTALRFKIYDDLATCDLVDGIQSRDEQKIGRALRQKYPGLDATLLAEAEKGYEQLAREGEPEDRPGVGGLLSKEEITFVKNLEFDAQETADALAWVLDAYGILYSENNHQGFKVKVDAGVTSIDVRDKSADGPTVFIPASRKMDGVTLLSLIAHEIEGHARQSINGERLFKVGGGRLKVDNEQLYEGLGLRYETRIKRKLFGIHDAAPRPYYVFAVKKAEEGGSFFDIFQEQISMRLHVALKVPLDQDLPARDVTPQAILDQAKRDAWLTTYRVMRGHIDMTNPFSFAMAKDLGYLRGYQIDSQLQENNVGFLNEAGVIASGGLQLLAELALSEDSLPIPFKDLATKYWEEVMKPQMNAASTTTTS